MARELREWYPGAIYHVMARGIRRMAIYKEEEDYLSFLYLLKRFSEVYQFEIYSLCLMTNHFHLLIKTGEKPIWMIMSALLQNYASCFNRKYHYSGHLFESRYVSRVIEDSIRMLEVSRYIHLNPVKAKMVIDPENYLFSSYWILSGLGPIKTEGELFSELLLELIHPDKIWEMFSHDAERQYRAYVEDMISHEEMEKCIQVEMKEDDKWLPW